MQKADQQRLDEFYAEFHEHLQREDDQMKRLIECQQANAEAIAKLTAVCIKMEGVLEVYEAIIGTIKTGAAAQRLGLWVLKWPLIGTGLYTIYQWVLDHFSQR